jgi:hypothetical protein
MTRTWNFYAGPATLPPPALDGDGDLPPITGI